MGILVITNKFELGMIEETCILARGMAVSMPENQDIVNLIKEYVDRDYHLIHAHFQNRGTYESAHEGFYFRKALSRFARPTNLLLHPSPFQFGSHIFTEGDHIMIIQNTYDPVFSEDEFDINWMKTYLLSF